MADINTLKANTTALQSILARVESMSIGGSTINGFDINVVAHDNFKKGDLAYLIRNPSEPYDVNYHSTLEGNYEYFALSPVGDAMLLGEYSDKEKKDLLYVYSLEDGELTKVKNNYLSDLHLIDRRRVAFSKDGKWMAVANNTIKPAVGNGTSLTRKHLEMYSVSGSTLVKVDSLSLNSTDIDLSTAPFGFNEDGSLFVVSNRVYSFVDGKLKLLEVLNFTSADILDVNFSGSSLLISTKNKIVCYDNYRSSKVESRWIRGDSTTTFIPHDGYMTIGPRPTSSTVAYESIVTLDTTCVDPLTATAKFRLSDSAGTEETVIKARIELRTFEGEPAYMTQEWITLVLYKNEWVTFDQICSCGLGRNIQDCRVRILIQGLKDSSIAPIDVCDCAITMSYNETEGLITGSNVSPDETITIINKDTVPYRHLNIKSDTANIDGTTVPVYDFGTKIVFSKNDSMFITCGDNRYDGYTAGRVYKIENEVAVEIGQLLDTDGNAVIVKDASFSNGNKLIAAYDVSSKVILLYQINETEITLLKAIELLYTDDISNMRFSNNGESLVAITDSGCILTFSVNSTAHAYRSLKDAPERKFYEISCINEDVTADNNATAKVYLKIHNDIENTVKNDRVKLYAKEWLQDGTSNSDYVRTQRIGYVDPSVYDPNVGGSDNALRIFYNTSGSLPDGSSFSYDTTIGSDWKEIDVPFYVAEGTGDNLVLSFLGGIPATDTQSYEIKDIAIYDPTDSYQTNLINAPIATADIVASGSNIGVCVLNDGETDYIHISDQNASYRQIHYYTETDFAAGNYRFRCAMRRSPRINIQSVVVNDVKRDDVVFTNTDHRIYSADTIVNAYSIAKGDSRVIFSCEEVPNNDIVAEVVSLSTTAKSKITRNNEIGYINADEVSY